MFNLVAQRSQVHHGAYLNCFLEVTLNLDYYLSRARNDLQTADYGPYVFLDGYDETYVGNTSDDSGRYAFGKQPEIALWNLKMLSEELSVCLGIEKQLLEEVRGERHRFGHPAVHAPL